MTEYSLDLSETDMSLLFPPESYPITRQLATQHALAEWILSQYNDPKSESFGGAGILNPKRDGASISIGQPAESLNWDAVERWNLDIGRRLSIGYGHYHTESQIVFAMGFSHGLVAEQFDSATELMSAVKEPVIEALDRIGITAKPPSRALVHSPLDRDSACLTGVFNEVSDLMVGDRKISTSVAHMEIEGTVVAHGTIEYELRPERVMNLFNIDATEAQFREQITCITDHVDIERETAVSIFEETLREWAYTDELANEARDAVIDRARQLEVEKYAIESWIMEPKEMTANLGDFSEVVNS